MTLRGQNAIRLNRAYIASLGTTGVLVASAVLLLAVVSTLLAFRAWPGSALVDGIGSLVVRDSERSLRLQGPAQTAVDAAPAAAAVASAPAPGSAAASPAPVAAGSPALSTAPLNGTGGPDGVGNVAPNGAVPVVPVAPVGDRRGPAAGGLIPAGPASDSVRGVSDNLSATARGLTGAAGDTVGQLNPKLGETVTDTGRALSEIVRRLGGR